MEIVLELCGLWVYGFVMWGLGFLGDSGSKPLLLAGSPAARRTIPAETVRTKGE